MLYAVLVDLGPIFTAAVRVRIPVAVKFHNFYDYTSVAPCHVSENHKPQVHPSHVREIGQSVGYDETQDEL